MKKLVCLLLLFSVTTIFPTTYEAPKYWQMSTVLKKAQQKGYKNIYRAELVGRGYKIAGFNAQGAPIELTINAETGAILKPKPLKHALTIIDAAIKAEAEGYHYIQKIKIANGKYELRAINKNNNKVVLEIDAKTGKISKAI